MSQTQSPSLLGCLKPDKKEPPKRPPDSDSEFEEEGDSSSCSCCYTQHVNAEWKVMFVGPTEAGKTTMLKQMTLIHRPRYFRKYQRNEQKRAELVASIRRNVLDCIYMLIKAAWDRWHPPMVLNKIVSENPPMEYISSAVEDNNFNYSEKLIKAAWDGWHPPMVPNEIITEHIPMKYISSAVEDNNFNNYSEEFFDLVDELWANETIQKCYEQRHKFQLMDCAKYFLDSTARIRRADYMPSDEDKIRVRKRTSGINPTYFKSREAKIEIFDVGGQTGERRKYVSLFEDLTSIMFVASLSCYNMDTPPGQSEPVRNQLVNSLDMFRTMWNHRYLEKINMILFLNKEDIFEEQIRSGNHPLESYFSEYTDYLSEIGAEDITVDDKVLHGKSFIRDLFVRQIHQYIKYQQGYEWTGSNPESKPEPNYTYKECSVIYLREEDQLDSAGKAPPRRQPHSRTQQSSDRIPSLSQFISLFNRHSSTDNSSNSAQVFNKPRSRSLETPSQHGDWVAQISKGTRNSENGTLCYIKNGSANKDTAVFSRLDEGQMDAFYQPYSTASSLALTAKPSGQLAPMRSPISGLQGSPFETIHEEPLVGKTYEKLIKETNGNVRFDGNDSDTDDRSDDMLPLIDPQPSTSAGPPSSSSSVAKRRHSEGNYFGGKIGNGQWSRSHRRSSSASRRRSSGRGHRRNRDQSKCEPLSRDSLVNPDPHDGISMPCGSKDGFKHLYPHFTTAVRKDNIDHVFQSVDKILKGQILGDIFFA